MSILGRKYGWRTGIGMVILLLIALAYLTLTVAHGHEYWPAGVWTLVALDEDGMPIQKFTVTRVELESEYRTPESPFWTGSEAGRQYPLDNPLPSKDGRFVLALSADDVVRASGCTKRVLGIIRWSSRVDYRIGLRIEVLGFLGRTIDLSDIVDGPPIHRVSLRRNPELLE